MNEFDPVDAARAGVARLKRWARRQDPREVALFGGGALAGLALGVAGGRLVGRTRGASASRLEAAVRRAESDAETARRVAARDVASAKKFGHAKVCSQFFGVADSLRLAVAAPGADAAGFAALDAQLHAALAASDVEVFEPAAGDTFDPECMEALRAAAPSDGGATVVAEVLQRGYRLHDRVIRAAAVATGPRAGGGGPAED